GRRRGGAAPWPRAGGAGVGAERGAVRFLLRAAAGLVRRFGRAVLADLPGIAGGGTADRPTDRRAAPAGAHLDPARGRGARPVRVRARTVVGPAAAADRGFGGRVHPGDVRRALRLVHTRPGRAPGAGGGARAGTRRARPRRGAVGVRPWPARRRRHRHAGDQRVAVLAAEGAAAHARRVGGGEPGAGGVQRAGRAPADRDV